LSDTLLLVPTPLSAYQKKLFAFLSVATFFEGYDFIALTQILPNMRAEWSLGTETAGRLVSFVNIGTVIALFLVRKADTWGRRSALTVTIVGYTLTTLLSGLAPNLYLFAAFQLLARVFLIGEWAITMVYAAEEYPADRRGMVIGVIQAFSALGSIVCAGAVPLLLRGPWGWRTVYFVGVIPLVIMAVARRSLRESSRYTGPPAKKLPLSRILHSSHRGRMLQLALIWAVTYVCTQTAVTFWKEFATAERGFSDAQVGKAISIAAVAAMPLVFFAGRLLDIAGRRRGAVVIFSLTSAGVAGAYLLHGEGLLTAALTLAIFGASAVLPVLNAYTAEMFPTEFRADAFAWSNNLLGRVGYVLSPLVVGELASRHGWGPSVAATAAFPLIALVLILAWLPETRGRELEEIAG
jgi:MFS transporter, putative metabolite:H+ symporter